MSPTVRQQIARTVYRALCRNSKHGRHLEVLGNPGGFLPQHLKEPPNLVFNSQAQAKQELSQLFREDYSSSMDEKKRIETLLIMMRASNALVSIYTLENMPDELPIFDFTATGLMGESLDFNFFENRYRYLVKEQVTKHEGLFLLRASNGVTVLGKIVEHGDLEQPQIIVNCLFGPRMKVLEEREHAIDPDPLPIATRFERVYDEDRQDESLPTLRRVALELLKQSFKDPNMLLTSMIPPLDPEVFSMWIVRFMSRPNEMGYRWQWLSCRSTRDRLEHAIGVLEEQLASSNSKE